MKTNVSKQDIINRLFNISFVVLFFYSSQSFALADAKYGSDKNPLEGVVENVMGDATANGRCLSVGSVIRIGDRVSVRDYGNEKGFLLIRFKNSTLQLRGKGELVIDQAIMRTDKDVFSFAADFLSVIFRSFSPPPQDQSEMITGVIGVRG